MHLRLITAPTVEPVSVATARLFLRVDGSDDDTVITLLTKAAREKGEELARRAFISQTWEMIIDCWPHDLRLKVYRPPLISVSFVKYLDSSNVEHTFTDYVVDTRNEPGVIIFNTLPGEALLKSGAITVRFVAGYGAAETNVPDRIKTAILLLVAHWYEHRETINIGNIVSEVPMGSKLLFIAERVVWF
jgi:uncharacterized phiE125 gp8 family phage protein